MTTFLHEQSGGRLVEYRRLHVDRVLFLESRVLKPDGTSYDDQWFPVSDSELLYLNHADTGILDLLDPRG